MSLAEFEEVATDFVQPFAALGTPQACVALTQNALSLCATVQGVVHTVISLFVGAVGPPLFSLAG